MDDSFFDDGGGCGSFDRVVCSFDGEVAVVVMCAVSVVFYLGGWCVWECWVGLEYEGVSAADTKKMSILGALNLYLDFINIFLFLLRLFGNRRG